MRLFASVLLALLCLLTAYYAGAPLPWPAAADWLYLAIQAGAASACFWRAWRGPDRAAWALMGIGLTSFFAGDLYYQFAFAHTDDVPFPSPADAGYLGFYPFTYVALVLFVRGRVRRVPAGLWLDG